MRQPTSSRQPDPTLANSRKVAEAVLAAAEAVLVEEEASAADGAPGPHREADVGVAVAEAAQEVGAAAVAEPNRPEAISPRTARRRTAIWPAASRRARDEAKEGVAVDVAVD